jgi:DNA-binding CsgD family transcriptional regulator
MMLEIERRLDPDASVALASDLLELALVGYERAGDRRRADRVRVTLSRLREPDLDAGASLLGLLSAAELRVAVLVADGLSNKDIAAALHLSRYTIESHLRSSFAKLGISSRAHLAARVATARAARTAAATNSA